MLGIPGEEPEDAFKTMRMLKRMKRVMPSISFYAPYPGSALGYQLIAEGKSLMSKDNYHRFPDDEKVKGVDYDAEVLPRPCWPASTTSSEPPLHVNGAKGPDATRELTRGRWDDLGSDAESWVIDSDEWLVWNLSEAREPAGILI
jgi:radical SAM superfamily enzyme YgiQ (UPF0313 family)